MSVIPEQAPAQRRLRVHVPATISRSLIAPTLPRLLRQHPGLRVQITEAPAIGKLPSDVDAAVCVGSIADETLVARRIGSIHAITCAAPDFIDAMGFPLTPADLDPEHCIGLLEQGSNKVRDWTFRKGAETYSVAPGAPLAFSDAQSAVEATVRGAGCVRVMCFEAAQKVASGLLQPMLEDWNSGSVPVSMVYARHRAQSHDIELFATFLAGLFPLRHVRVNYLDERASVSTGT